MDRAGSIKDDNDVTATEQHIFDVRQDDSRTLAIVTAVADVLNCDPLDLPELLYDAVDVDAINALFRVDNQPTDTPFVSFEYCGYTVGVESQRIIVAS